LNNSQDLLTFFITNNSIINEDFLKNKKMEGYTQKEMFSSVPHFTHRKEEEEMEDKPRPCVSRGGGLPCEFEEDLNSAELVCKFCGLVGARILSAEDEKVYDEEDNKNLRSDGSTETTLSQKAYNANVSGLGSGFTAADRTIEFKRRYKAREKRKLHYLALLKKQCAKMSLGGKASDYCIKLFTEYADNAKSFSEKKMPEIMLGVIFHACTKMDYGFQRRIAELSRQTGVPEAQIRNGMKLIESVCKVSQGKYKTEPLYFIPRYCQNLLYDKLHVQMPNGQIDPVANYALNQFTSKADAVARYVNEFLEGKKPNTVAAADIALTVKWFYGMRIDLSDSEIAQGTDVTLKTLKSTIEKVEKEMEAHGLDTAAIVKEIESRFTEE